MSRKHTKQITKKTEAAISMGEGASKTIQPSINVTEHMNKASNLKTKIIKLVSTEFLNLYIPV